MRNKLNIGKSKQAMGMFFSPQWLHDHKDMEEAIRECANGSFGIIVGHVRHMNLDFPDKEVYEAVKSAVNSSHKYGVRFALDMDWAWWAQPFVERNPDMAQWLIVPGEGICENGQFDFTVPFEGNGQIKRYLEYLPAVYSFDSSGKTRLLGKNDYEVRMETFTATCPIPDYENRIFPTPARIGKGGSTHLRLSGKLKDSSICKIRIYVAWESYKYPDVTHPDYLKKQIEILEMYKDIELDGVTWDEPGKGSSLKGYKAGKEFLDFFRKTCGYDLREKLIDLDMGDSSGAMKTRHDYYKVVNEMNYNAQAAFNNRARELFGKDIFLGNHQTFSGPAIDLRAGCIDYFKLGTILSEAFTDTGWDCSWTAETTYSYVLVESLRKELGKTIAYEMDWSKTPHVSWYDYYTRMKMLYAIDWFMIFLSRWGEGHLTLPWDRHWPSVAGNAKVLEKFAAFTKRKVIGYSEMVVWHSWQAPAYLEFSYYTYIRLWMTCNYNLSQSAFDESRFFDYASTSTLENAKVADGRIHLPGGTYGRLALPFAIIIGEKLWKKARECVKEGIELVFIGPPPHRLLESGKDISEEFCNLCGIEHVDFKRYHSWLSSHKPLPKFDDWEPQTFDFAFPVTPFKGTDTMKNSDGEIIGVRNPHNGVTWLTTPDPRGLFHRNIPAIHPQGIEIEHFGRSSFRILQDQKNPTEFILVCASRMDEKLHDVFSVNGKVITLKDGCWAALRLSNGRIIDKMLDKDNQCLQG